MLLLDVAVREAGCVRGVDALPTYANSRGGAVDVQRPIALEDAPEVVA